MNKINMNIQRVGDVEVPIPKYGTSGSAGFDLQAAIKEPISISPNNKNWVLIPTGLSIEIPEGFEAQIRPRSGLALKYGISVLNSPATIDSDYRGSVGVILVNNGVGEFIVNPLDRIAQMVISPVFQVDFKLVESLSDTNRGAGGFGSTGTNG